MHKGIQDDVMEEDDETVVKGKAHCVIKMKACSQANQTD
jgi:hypothetical protein